MEYDLGYSIWRPEPWNRKKIHLPKSVIDLSGSFGPSVTKDQSHTALGMHAQV